MAEVKLIVFSLVAMIVVTNAQQSGLGLLGGLLGGGGSASGSGSFNLSGGSTADNRTVVILRSILRTPFTKAGFFRKLSLLQMLNQNGGGFGFNKSFLFGGSAQTTTTTTTETPSETTPFPDTVFRPDSNGGAKVNIAGSISIGTKAAVSNDKDDKNEEGEEDEEDKETESTNSSSSITKVGGEVSKESEGESKVNGGDRVNSIFKAQGGINVNAGGVSLNAGGVSANAGGDIANGKASASSLSLAKGYQYFPAGPDRLTLPTNLQASSSSESNKRSVSSNNESNFRLKAFIPTIPAREIATDIEIESQRIQKTNDLTTPEEINNLKEI